MIIMCTMTASKAQAQAALTKDRDREVWADENHRICGVYNDQPRLQM